MRGPLPPTLAATNRERPSPGEIVADEGVAVGGIIPQAPVELKTLIEVPSQFPLPVDVRAALGCAALCCGALCFFGRADAVAAVPTRRTARARVSILDRGPLIPVQISSSSRSPLQDWQHF